MSQYTKEGTYGFPIFGSSNVHLQSRTGAADMRILSEAASRYYMYMSANSKDSGKTALMRSLASAFAVAYVISTLFLRAGSNVLTKKH